MPGFPTADFPHVLALSNGDVEAHVSVSVGPRILHYGRTGGENLFATTPLPPIPTAFGPWHPRGGHRLWVAPESLPGSYAPDDQPVAVEQHSAVSATFRQPTDAAGIEKQVTVTLAPAGTGVTVRHTITNRLCWPIDVAPWGITSLTPGVAVIPQPPFMSHDDELLPARPLVQWAFTDLSDARWSIGRRLIRLAADASRPSPQKIGAGNRSGWCALVTAGGAVYLKSIAWQAGARYPDHGCTNEVYTAADYLELESLGPLQLLSPGESTAHEERWAIGALPALEPLAAGGEDLLADHLETLARNLLEVAAA